MHYKIINKQTKSFYYFNSKQKANFEKLNNMQKYTVINLTEVTRQKKVKFFTNILFTVATFATLYGLIYCLCAILSLIDFLTL